ARPGVDGRVVGEPADVGAVGVHQVDLVVPGPVAAEGDLFAVGRPRRLVVGGHLAGEALDVLPLGVGDVQFRVAVAGADPQQLLAVGRPARRLLERLVRDEDLVAGAVGGDGVDLQLAVGALEAVVHVGDRFAVGRPVAVEVGHGLGGQDALEAGAVGVHGPQGHLALVDAGEDELLAVGRVVQVRLVAAVAGQADGGGRRGRGSGGQDRRQPGQ